MICTVEYVIGLAVIWTVGHHGRVGSRYEIRIDNITRDERGKNRVPEDCLAHALAFKLRIVYVGELAYEYEYFLPFPSPFRFRILLYLYVIIFHSISYCLYFILGLKAYQGLLNSINLCISLSFATTYLNRLYGF